VWPGLCYTCATGLPRQVRPRPDAAEDPRLEEVGASEQPGPGA
jgi:hypothetical protein